MVADGSVEMGDAGDSGGPVFLGQTAYGIIIGAGAGSTDHTMVYMAINYINSLNVEVRLST